MVYANFKYAAANLKILQSLLALPLRLPSPATATPGNTTAAATTAARVINSNDNGNAIAAFSVTNVANSSNSATIAALTTSAVQGVRTIAS